MKRKQLQKDEEIKLLRRTLRHIFGINAKIDTSKFKWEQGRIEIREVDWNEALLDILKRLQDSFYIDITSELVENTYWTKKDAKILGIPFRKNSKERFCSILVIELTKRD